ncbi:uncharacterized protein C8A04DRAFT_32682 [Dichotomopilus funicola]|uniref:Uncharacterized protein n=1 Tax=Dichotomopilus funicola TaxID=1934379 RepID=A0AAN6UV38_9PEZI|nr:hypothetical protein C8A04DRAFT_32682 [Dichotomopilus funicola]
MPGPYWNPLEQLELADSPTPATLQCARIMPPHLNAYCWAVIPESAAAEALDLVCELADTPPTMVRQQQLADLAKLCLCEERHAGHVDATVKAWMRIVDEVALKFREERHEEEWHEVEGHDVKRSDSRSQDERKGKIQHKNEDEKGEHKIEDESNGIVSSETATEARSNSKSEIDGETKKQSNSEEEDEKEGQQGQPDSATEAKTLDPSFYVFVERRRWEMLEHGYTVAHQLLGFSESSPEETVNEDSPRRSPDDSLDSSSDSFCHQNNGCNYDICYDSLPKLILRLILTASDNETLLRRTIDTVERELERAERRVESLETSLEESNQRVEALQVAQTTPREQSHFAKVQQSLHEAHEEQAALRSRVEVAEHSMRATHMGLTKAQAEVDRLMKEDAKTREQLHEANDRAREVLALMDAERDRTKELEKIRCDLGQRIVALEAEQADAEAGQENQTGESSQKSESPSLEHQLADVTTTSERAIHAIERRNQTLQKIRTELQDRLAAVRAVGERHERELAEKAANLEGVHRRDENRIERLRQCVARYQTKYQSSVAQEQQTQSVLRSAQQAANPLRSCNEHLRKEIARLKGEIEALEDEQASKPRGWRGRLKAWVGRKSEAVGSASSTSSAKSEAVPEMDGQPPAFSARPFPSLF